MLQNDELSLQDIESHHLSQPWLQTDELIEPKLVASVGSGSGGYADHIFRFAAKELFGKECDKLEYKTLRQEQAHFVR